MKKLALALLAGAAFAPAVSMADAGDVLVRVRGLAIVPDNSATNVVESLGVHAKQALTPELDLTYMFTKNIGAELILGTSKHDLNADTGPLGSTWVLPPTLTVQYHFMPDADFRPYVGAGLNYTRFYNTDLPEGLSIKKNSWGGALQVGADYAINKNVFVNLDVKKVWMKTTVYSNGADAGDLKINPWIIGVGIGTKF